MAKNRSGATPHYEMLYIVSNRYTDEEAGPVAGQIEQIIKKHGGEISYQETWGRKKFTYPINNEQYGHYFLVEFDLKEAKQAELDRELRLNNEVVRHLIVSKKSRSLEQIQADKRAEDKRAEERLRKTEEKDKPAEKEAPRTAAKAKKPIDLKDLDAKLDKILDTDDLL